MPIPNNWDTAEQQKMLPTTYFERVTGQPRLKTDHTNRERRTHCRIDVRLKAYLCLLTHGITQLPQQVRLREMSATGASMVTQSKIKPGEEFLIRLEGRDGGIYWIWARCRRFGQLDSVASRIGMVFVRILYPDQVIMPGTTPHSFRWEEVEGIVKPEDPFISKAA